MSAIAVDVMGGDHAPGPEVAGAVEAVRAGVDKVFLVGRERVIEQELKRVGAARADDIEVVHAEEVVDMSDAPGQAFRQKPNSSLRKAFELVKAGSADGVVSAGNSGAILAHALFVLKRIKHVERPGIVTVFPTPEGKLVLCDMGANVDVKSTALAQFGILGAHYDRIVHGHGRPRVGLLSNGTEDKKGTDLTRAAHKLLTQAAAHPDAVFDYVGYVEGSEIFHGHIDCVATDGFTGNVVLKTAEGVAEAVMRMIKKTFSHNTLAKVGALMVKPAFMDVRKRLDYAEAGGALLLGVDGICCICHGRSDAVAIKNAVRGAARYADLDLAGQLATAMARHEDLWRGVKEAAKESA